MACGLRYDVRVMRRNAALVAGFALGAWLALGASARAQVNGPPSSVTSPGFGGHAVNGVAPSVTSVGPHGYAPGPVVNTPVVGTAGNGEHHHHHESDDRIPLLYAFPVPYAVGDDTAEDTTDADQNDAEQQGGPTGLDRRGTGAGSYVPPAENVPKPHPAALANNSSAEAASPPAATLLVFKDGHKIEVGNYAIVGATLFDLTPGHARRVAVADLDLDATRKQNEDRGVVFELPTVRAY
jgi:hypothetical protein